MISWYLLSRKPILSRFKHISIVNIKLFFQLELPTSNITSSFIIYTANDNVILFMRWETAFDMKVECLGGLENYQKWAISKCLTQIEILENIYMVHFCTTNLSIMYDSNGKNLEFSLYNLNVADIIYPDAFIKYLEKFHSWYLSTHPRCFQIRIQKYMFISFCRIVGKAHKYILNSPEYNFNKEEYEHYLLEISKKIVNPDEYYSLMED